MRSPSRAAIAAYSWSMVALLRLRQRVTCMHASEKRGRFDCLRHGTLQPTTRNTLLVLLLMLMLLLLLLLLMLLLTPNAPTDLRLTPSMFF